MERLAVVIGDVGDLEAAGFASDSALVGRLAAALRVEDGLVEDDGGLFALGGDVDYFGGGGFEIGISEVKKFGF